MDIDSLQMREHQRPRQPFVISLNVLSHHHYRHGGGDALIPGTLVAHRLQRRASHAGIRGCAGADNNV